jgi:hypothetical protein
MEATLDSAKALSVKQPWAEFILSGRKTIELRRWSAPYRGPLWLHTGASPDERAMLHFHMSDLFIGGYVGLVTVEDIVSMDRKRWTQWRHLHLDPGISGEGLWAWLLSQPRRLSTPLAGGGALKLFDVHPQIAQTLRDRLLTDR